MVVAESLIVFILAAAIVALVVRWRDRLRSRARGEATAPGSAAYRRFRRRNAGAVVAGVAAFFGCGALNVVFADLAGIVFTLAPGAAAIAALLTIALVPVSQRVTTGRRVASLERRTPWSFAPAWTFILVGLASAGVLVSLVLMGFASSCDADGQCRSITVTSGQYVSSSGPYPGWYYGIPLIVVTLALAACTFFALARIAAAPAATDANDIEDDRVLRAVSTAMVTKLSAGALLAYFGIILFAAGICTQSAATLGDGTQVEPIHAVGVFEVATSAFVLVTGMALLLGAIADATRSPFSSRAVAGVSA